MWITYQMYPVRDQWLLCNVQWKTDMQRNICHMLCQKCLESLVIYSSTRIYNEWTNTFIQVPAMNRKKKLTVCKIYTLTLQIDD